MFLSKYGVARHIRIPIVKRGVVDLAISTDWTPVAGDVKISKDGGAFANVTNLPTAINSANTGAIWDFSLTATEMQAAQVVVVVSDAATKAVEDQTFEIETYGHASAQHELDLDTPTVNPGTAGITSAAFAAGAIDANALATDAFGALELAAGAATEIATAVWATAMSELTSVPAPSDTVLKALEWLFAVTRNKVTQTSAQAKVYKDDDGTVLGTSGSTDVGGVFTRGKYA